MMRLPTLLGREPRFKHEQRFAAGETNRPRNWFPLRPPLLSRFPS